MNYITAFVVVFLGTTYAALSGQDVTWHLASDGNVAAALWLAWLFGRWKGQRRTHDVFVHNSSVKDGE